MIVKKLWYIIPFLLINSLSNTHTVIISPTQTPPIVHNQQQRFFLNIAPIIPEDERSSYITPGQVRIAQKNAAMKMNEAKKKFNIKSKAEGGVLPYNNNTSILSLEQALPVIKAPFGYVLVDGHHDSVASLMMGASTIPVKVVDDLSGHIGIVTTNAQTDFRNPVFWEVAKSRGYVYPYDLQGNWKIPANFADLEDDQNRYFAAIIARKCDFEGQPVGESKGALYPVWIKIGKDIPFIEFMISDALIKAGLQYTYDMGDNVDSDEMKDFVEKTREALKKANIPGLKLVPSRIKYTEIPQLCGEKKNP